MIIIAYAICLVLVAIIGACGIKFFVSDDECRYLLCCVFTDKTNANAPVYETELQWQPMAGRSGTTNRISFTTSIGPPIDSNNCPPDYSQYEQYRQPAQVRYKLMAPSITLSYTGT